MILLPRAGGTGGGGAPQVAHLGGTTSRAERYRQTCHRCTYHAVRYSNR